VDLQRIEHAGQRLLGNIWSQADRDEGPA